MCCFCEFDGFFIREANWRRLGGVDAQRLGGPAVPLFEHKIVTLVAVNAFTKCLVIWIVPFFGVICRGVSQYMFAYILYFLYNNIGSNK